MAHACSAPEDTVHYMHSMNWVKDVMGASHLDLMIAVRDDKRKEVGTGDLASLQLRRSWMICCFFDAGIARGALMM